MRAAILLAVVLGACSIRSATFIGGGGSDASGDDDTDAGSGSGSGSQRPDAPTACSTVLTCPQPANASFETACGQLYDLQTSAPFADTNATGARCTTGATTGPCALAVSAYDSISFISDPGTAQKIPTGPLYIDTCGRYQLPDIAQPSSSFLGLVVDDADGANAGASGATNTVAMNQPFAAGAQPDIDNWVASIATTNGWSANGAPSVATGFWVGIFFAHQTGRDLQSGVSVLRNGSTDPNNDYYFANTDATRTAIGPGTVATGANGTSLDTNATSLTNTYSGTGGGLSATCAWPMAPVVSLAGILAVQEYRPIDNAGTCDR